MRRTQGTGADPRDRAAYCTASKMCHSQRSRCLMNALCEQLHHRTFKTNMWETIKASRIAVWTPCQKLFSEMVSIICACFQDANKNVRVAAVEALTHSQTSLKHAATTARLLYPYSFLRHNHQCMQCFKKSLHYWGRRARFG